ncbi:NTP transferase domain-containing protein [candidate division GN15 bacterium]|nr:NTP transferase domain-containing protein [candidate division GN15 bacterium]
MKAILMAGGFGTRLRPLTINLPKPMVPIGNIPIMEHVISLLARHGITDITSLLYFQPDEIKNYFGDGSRFGVKMDYCLPDADYGTAGAVRFALGDSQDRVLVISGDLITDFDLSEAISWHEEKRSEATILLTRIENPLAYGIVITSADGRIVRFLEKPSWGEAFSDTINTGIYILDPAAVRHIPKQTNFDFSQNLYPLMLSKGMGLYGKIMEGYWKDVGNVNEYRLAHQDMFHNNLSLDLKADLERRDDASIYRGQNVTIEDGARFEGTVVLGDDVYIEHGVTLSNCAVGSRSRIGRDSTLRNTIVWADNLLGHSVSADDGIICNRSKVGSDSRLAEKVIISDNCVVGDKVTIKPNCKIWPGKTVDDGAIVSSSLIWGDKWNRELFTDSKLTGLALTEVTPEMTVRLGSALGASLGTGSTVVTSRDASDLSRLLRRSLLSGLLASGVHVADLEAMPVPIVRYGLSQGHFAAGIYVRHNPLDYRLIDFILFDGSGLDMPTARLKKIERNYFGEDYDRASLDNIGHLERPQGVLLDYRHDFLQEIDTDIIRQAGFKIVVDHSNGPSSQLFPDLFSVLGVSATELNANLNPRKFSSTSSDRSQALVQLSAIVSSIKADFGVIYNSAAEKLTVVDETGTPLDSQLLLMIVTDLFIRAVKPQRIAVPVMASMGVDQIAADHGVEVVRVGSDHRSMMEIRRSGEVGFVGGTRGGFIFPGFQMGADALFATSKILELMARTRSSLGDLRRKYDRFQRRAGSVPCPWSRKGTVMRQLITSTQDKQRELIDGVRVFENGGWVLVAPDRAKASFNIMAESDSAETSEALLKQYAQLVEEWQS